MSQSGLESRYFNRFSGIKKQSGDSIKNIDAAGNLTEHLTTAKASLKAQEKNINELFSTAQELISGIDTCQQMFGHTFVKNMPLPTETIKSSPGKQMGYVQLSMRFLQAGVVYFMEQMSDAEERIDQLEKLVKKLSEYDEEVDLIGDLQRLDLENLEQVRPVAPPSITTPPASPISDKKEKVHKAEKPEKTVNKKK